MSALAPRCRRGFKILACIAVVCLGTGVRMIGGANRGLLLWDEGMNLCEARYVAGALHAIPAVARIAWLTGVRGKVDSPELQRLREEVGQAVAKGSYPCNARETHLLLTAVLLLIVGDADWVGNAESVIFAVLTLVLVFALGCSMYGESGGLLAALVLGLCPLHIFLSRGSLPESDAIFFLLAAVALVRHAVNVDRSPLSRLFLAGLAAGLSFSCNKRLVIVPLVVLSVFVGGQLESRRPLAGLRARGLLWLCVGMILPLLAWESVYRAAFWLLPVPGQEWRPTYFTTILYAGSALGLPAFGLGDSGSLPFFLGEYVGVGVVAVAISGLLLELSRGKADGLYVALPILWAVLFFQLRSHQQSVRYLGAAVPFIALAAGAVLRPIESLTRICKWGHAGLPWVALAGVLACALADRREWAQDRSGMPQVFAWLHQRCERRDCIGFVTSDAPLAWFYDPTPSTVVVHAFDSEAELYRHFRSGVRYLVVTPNVFLLRPSNPKLWLFLRDLHDHVRPIEFPHPGGRLPYLAHEHNTFSWDELAETQRRADQLARYGGTIRVYDLLAYYRQKPPRRPGK